jgi:hypothetical protein
MKYTVWFYAHNEHTGTFTRRYDLFTGTRYECYKYRSYKRDFQWQYKVCKA